MVVWNADTPHQLGDDRAAAIRRALESAYAVRDCAPLPPRIQRLLDQLARSFSLAISEAESAWIIETLPADSAEAFLAVDAWLYHRPFRHGGRLYRIARYYPLIEPGRAAIVVTLDPIGECDSSLDTGAEH